jgi:6-pyruvoyltetrahydropterin/6-carboxytetrahydropterin synthase
MLLRKTFRFEASHMLSRHPGKCKNLHGHSWVLHVFVEGPIEEETGFVVDFADISKWVKPLIEQLDHKHLGQWEVDGQWIPIRPTWKVLKIPENFYPTSENLLYWIGTSLFPMRWSKLALEETCTSYAELTRSEFDATRNKS